LEVIFPDLVRFLWFGVQNLVWCFPFQLARKDKRTKVQNHLIQFLKCQKFGGSLGLSSPVVFSWFPTDPTVCPSTLALYIANQGVKVTELRSENGIIRLNSANGKIPGFQFQEGEDVDLREFENWVGAAFLQIPM
jgi:hypothetical protein